MTTKKRLSLEEKLDEWIREEPDFEENPESYIPDDFVQSLADAVEVVFDSTASFQEWLRQNGYLK